jgi:hypothetical protein
LPLRELQLEYHHCLFTERDFGSGEMELPHAHKARVGKLLRCTLRSKGWSLAPRNGRSKTGPLSHRSRGALHICGRTSRRILPRHVQTFQPRRFDQTGLVRADNPGVGIRSVAIVPVLLLAHVQVRVALSTA